MHLMQVQSSFSELISFEIASIRANLIPMLVLWGFTMVVVAAYYICPIVSQNMKVFADWQVEYGKVASFINRFVCGGIVPGIFLLIMPSIRPQHAVATVLAQSVWCGLMGIAVDMFFTLQGVWFGTESKLKTALIKTIVDQFGFCVFFVTPLNAVFYAWMGNGFSFRHEGRYLSWFARSYSTNIVMNWCLVIPIMIAIYLFPMELQMTVSGFICAFWVLLAIFLGRKV